MNLQRWQALLVDLVAVADDGTFLQLRSAYNEKHRAYHTERHVDECLSVLDEWKDLALRPAEVECAIWFHDAVYQPFSSQNEERSAEWMAAFAKRSGMQDEKWERIRGHILATRHVGLAKDKDSALTVDIDLSILGADAIRYAEFERDIRTEYRWVPEFIYRSKRMALLRSFLERPRIYSSDRAYDRFEHIARANLNDSIERLSG
jgi:predicted metal-dependent HD superfamily phosphohydrolase